MRWFYYYYYYLGLNIRISNFFDFVPKLAEIGKFFKLFRSCCCFKLRKFSLIILILGFGEGVRRWVKGFTEVSLSPRANGVHHTSVYTHTPGTQGRLIYPYHIVDI